MNQTQLSTPIKTHEPHNREISEHQLEKVTTINRARSTPITRHEPHNKEISNFNCNKLKPQSSNYLLAAWVNDSIYVYTEQLTTEPHQLFFNSMLVVRYKQLVALLQQCKEARLPDLLEKKKIMLGQHHNFKFIRSNGLPVKIHCNTCGCNVKLIIWICFV